MTEVSSLKNKKKGIKYNIRKLYVIIKRKFNKFDSHIKRNVDCDCFFYNKNDGE